MADVTRARTPLGLAQADLDEVEAIVRGAGTSFYRGMRVLPPDRRHAMYAIYAFCRIVDDIADEAAPLEHKRAGLQHWRARIAGLYRGEATDAVTRALRAAVRQFALREADFLAVIDGMQTDAETTVVAPDLASLDLYCDRVASAVGRLSVRAFGDSSADADEVAYGLGRALQLTNILRDIKEDAERGRIYLPAEYLRDAGITADPATIEHQAGLKLVCSRVAELAHAHFGTAWAAMARCNPKAMRPARLMGATYAAILSAMERRGWDSVGERVTLPKWRKLWLACRYGLF